MPYENVTDGIWKHSHVFDIGNPIGERNTQRAVVLTSAMMVVEIVAGLMFNSMALLADGLHMSSHATALGLSALASMSSHESSPKICASHSEAGRL